MKPPKSLPYLLAALALIACSNSSNSPTLDVQAGDQVAADAEGTTDLLGDERGQADGLSRPDDVAIGDVSDAKVASDVTPDAEPIPDLVPDVCVPDCDGLACGDDGCGGSCGTCEEGYECEDGQCLGPPACASSKDCPDDLICDKDKGLCVACVTDADCPENHRCTEEQLCEEILFCETDKECKDFDKVCDFELGECVDCLTDADCPSEDTVCSGKQCKPLVCDPGAAVCFDDISLSQCNEDGTAAETLPCGEEFFCDLESAACLPWNCVPGSVMCDGDIALTCDTLGKVWGDGVDCTATEQTCVAGECIDCDPACGDRECGPDACGDSCGSCGDGLSCFVGYCLNQTCPTPCTGQTMEAFQCGLDLCTPDHVTAASVTTPAGDPLAQMFNVQTKYGADGNSLVPKQGSSLVIMATGKISQTQHEDEMPPANCVPDPIKQGQDCDVVHSDLSLVAPKGATGFSIDFVFLTKELEADKPYDDRFYILMNAPVSTGGETWVLNSMPCQGNATPDYSWNGTNYCYIRALSGFAKNPSPLDLTSTNFVASTPWLRTTWSIAPEEAFTLSFRVTDWTDGKYDSMAIIDNFQWHTTPVSPLTEPLP